jgi:cytochrome P450
MSELPPGPRAPMPVQTADYIRRPLALLDRCRERYGEPFTIRVARGAPFVVFSDPESVKRVFTGPPDVLRSGAANEVFKAGLGPRSLIVLDGEEHMRDRKLVLPPFHGERMRSYGALIDAIAEREVGSWPADRPFRLLEGTRRIALEVIVRAVFGVAEDERVGPMTKLLGRFLEAATPAPRVLALLLVKPDGLLVRSFNRFALTKRRVDAAIYEEIRRRRADPRLAEREDILSLLLQARYDDGEPLTDDHLRDELVTLLTAGHETTASTSAWALAALSRRPDLASRLDDDEVLDATVQEALRLWPVVPFVLRLTSAPFEVCGREMPAGVRLAPSVHLAHRRPEVYPSPGEFRPERFLERPPGTYTWFPFGGGTRRCVGAAFATFEMKRLLRVVSRAGRFEPAGEGRVGRRGLTLAPADGARLVWRPV